MTMKSNNFGVLYIAPHGLEYGSGHYHRGLMVQKALAASGVQCQTVSANEMPVIHSKEIKYVVLDGRDIDFPGWTDFFRKAGSLFIALDNRGKGRKQADIIWDTLPHPAMNLSEFGIALNRCFLPEEIRIHETKAQNAAVTLISKDEAFSRKGENVLIQDSMQNVSSRMEPNEFRSKLLNSQIVVTYFGQTFFEALFLGKQIYLYNISEYHDQLANYFLSYWNQYPELANRLDGLGIKRFIQKIIA